MPVIIPLLMFDLNAINATMNLNMITDQLNSVNWKIAIAKPLTNERRIKMYDLIYCGKDVEEIIKKRFPNAVIKDASDYVHDERFSIEDEDLNEDEYYPFIIKEGIGGCSFNLQLMMLQKQNTEKLLKWIEISKK
jgi:hypothetical protein